MELFILGAVGGAIPEVLRVIAWGRNPDPKKPTIPPWKDAGFFVSAVLAMGLGVLAVYLLKAITPIQAVAFGYAAPDLLTRAFAAIIGKPKSERAGEPPIFERLIVRWQP